MEGAVESLVHDRTQPAAFVIARNYADLPRRCADTRHGNKIRPQLGEPVDKLSDIRHAVSTGSVFHTGQEACLGYIRRYDIGLFYKAAEAFGHFIAEICIVFAVIGHGRIDNDERLVVFQKLDRALEQLSLRLGGEIAGIYCIEP